VFSKIVKSFIKSVREYMSKKTISLLINPRAGANTVKLPDVLAVLYAGGWKTQVHLKEYGKQAMELAREAAEEKQELVIAYGGDGTLNQVVNGIMSLRGKGKHTAAALIPGGTANVWAGEVGIPTDPVKAALAVINSDVRKVDVARIAVESLQFPGQEQPLEPAKADKKASEESSKVRHHFLLMAGLGLDAAIMSGVSKPLKYHIGPYAVGVSAAQILPEQHAFPIELQSGEKGDALWKGEALQVVIGNTRRYAKTQRMTPDAYVDDGQVDVCVITAGNPLTTLQQISSLLLLQKPDNTTAEYFKGAHVHIKIPASVPLQVDGSVVKLKDYLSSADYEKIAHLDHEGLDKVFVTYKIDVLPEALSIAIPSEYDNELFEHASSSNDDRAIEVKKTEDKETMKQEAKEKPDQRLKRGIFQRFSHPDDKIADTASQKRTVAIESLPESELHSGNGSAEEQKHEEELQQTQPDVVDALVRHGRRVTVIGKVPNPAQAHTYVIAGTIQKSTGETAPVAVVVNEKTAVFNRDGHSVSNTDDVIEELAEGSVLIVEGSRSKYSVIQAKRAVLA
jgi:YegS/Rv2252/BmrU family lipid kinase